VLVHEGGLQVQLGELRLAVGAQVLVAEAADDLVVAVEAGERMARVTSVRRRRWANISGRRRSMYR